MERINFLACGADPEVFFKTRAGEPYSAEGVVGGTKQEPRPIPKYPKGYFVQEDNVAAEYNIPPVSSAKNFSACIERGLSYLRKVAAQRNLELAIVPDLDFPIEMVMTPHAMNLGCDPDLNAWTGQMNPKPMPPLQMRSAAGHVHISWERPDMQQKLTLVKVLDAVLGLPSILVTPPSRRRQLYGRAGAMRNKPYGVEYRVLDNFWIPHDTYRRYIFDVIKTTIDDINTYPMFIDDVENYGEEIQEAINTHDVKLSTELLNTLQISTFPKL